MRVVAPAQPARESPDRRAAELRGGARRTIDEAPGAPALVRVSAYAVRANVPIQRWPGAMDSGLPTLASDRKHVVMGRPDGYLVAHDFGALVAVGDLGGLEKKALGAWSSLAMLDDPKPTTEDFAIVVEPGARLDARFDRLVVPELTPAIAEIVALVVGQSAALEHVEVEVDEVLGMIERHAVNLRNAGTFRASRRELLRLIGSGMALGNRAVLTLAILDAPLSSWNDEQLDRIHTGLQQAFGIVERYRALDHKLSTGQGSLELLVDVVQQRRGLVLEGTVIFLIALEIVLAVLH
jgi:uncharacterized Rmd1/YagE family protein